MDDKYILSEVVKRKIVEQLHSEISVHYDDNEDDKINVKRLIIYKENHFTVFGVLHFISILSTNINKFFNICKIKHFIIQCISKNIKSV